MFVVVILRKNLTSRTMFYCFVSINLCWMENFLSSILLQMLSLVRDHSVNLSLWFLQYFFKNSSWKALYWKCVHITGTCIHIVFCNTINQKKNQNVKTFENYEEIKFCPHTSTLSWKEARLGIKVFEALWTLFYRSMTVVRMLSKKYCSHTGIFT